MIKTLTNPNRQKVVRLLARWPMFGPELVSTLGLSQPPAHHHLAQLRAASLVRQERANGGMRYTLRPDTTAQAVKALASLFAGDGDLPRPGVWTRLLTHIYSAYWDPGRGRTNGDNR